MLDGGTFNMTGGGEYTTNPTAHIPTNWASGSDARNRCTLAHEIRHALGLNHNNCTKPYSLMSTDLMCNTDSGFADLPTISDVSPTVKGTYGGGTRKVCGL